VARPGPLQILRPHLNCTGNAFCARQHARLDMESLHRPARCGGDDAGSDARIHGETSATIAMLKTHRAVDDHRPPENDHRALLRQEVGPYTRYY
jgi:hypothetical protein